MKKQILIAACLAISAVACLANASSPKRGDAITTPALHASSPRSPPNASRPSWTPSGYHGLVEHPVHA